MQHCLENKRGEGRRSGFHVATQDASVAAIIDGRHKTQCGAGHVHLALRRALVENLGTMP
ncbi:hypothetical protein Z947_1453 [Sulfitobacter geojensis]|nr:hypothetical protein Z947_1453 [Sulfitobacter geojensis]